MKKQSQTQFHAQRRSLLLAGGLALAGHGTAQAADAFPSRPIKLLVGVPPGGIVDGVVRAASVEAAKKLGQPIAIDNKSGGGGVVTFVTLKNAPADGYTIGVLNLGAFRMPVVLAKPGYDPLKDFTYIASLMDISFCVVVPADSPFKSWQQLMDFGRANPGKVAYGTPNGLGGSSHIFGEEVTSREKLSWTPVPYRGSADAMTALLSGQLTFSVDTLVTSAPFAHEGKVRILAMATEQRQKSWPEVPTMRELGYGVTIDSSIGLGAPAGTPRAVVQRLQDAYRFAMEQPSVLDILKQGDQQPRYLDSQRYREFAVRSVEYQRQLLTKYGFAAKPSP